VELALRLVRRGGTIVIVGMPASGATVEIEPAGIAHDGIRILAASSDPRALRSTFPARRPLSRRRLQLDELISSRAPLAAINDAMDSAARGETLRAVITF